VLTRGTSESIMVGDQIEITVVEVRGDRVRIGIRAPASVTVHRKEVYLAIQEQNREAAKAAAVGAALLGELVARVQPKGKEA
jgi:carbon storage regulator